MEVNVLLKKKILFMAINMNVGGTEKALLNMLLEIPKEQFEITLLLLENRGGFLKDIPEHIQLRYLNEYQTIKSLLNLPLRCSVVRYLKQGVLLKAIKLFFLYVCSKLSKTPLSYYKYLSKSTTSLEAEYDVAIAYAGPMDFISFYVINKVRAKKKVQWVHFDISKISFNIKFANQVYKDFHKIFVVSNEGKKKLTDKLPVLKDRIETFFNITSKEVILKLASEGRGFEDSFQGTRILTVGRLSMEKGQDLAIPVLKKLKDEGYKVRWYCVGDGSAREEYQEKIKELNLQKEFILLGSKSNPYPYFQECDIYVQPSRHEGYCITLAEARCFNNPIVTTNFTGSSEQIKHEQNGLIVEVNVENLFQGIKRLLDDQFLRKRISLNLEKEVVDSRHEMNKFYRLVESASN